MSAGRAAAERYLALVYSGRNEWWRYGAGLLLIVLFFAVLGSVPLIVLRQVFEYSGMRAFLASNFAVLAALAGLVVAVVYVHKRGIMTLITPYGRFDWRRAMVGAGVWLLLGAVMCGLESVLYPGRYRYTFNPDSFFYFAAVALLLTPLQTATEELLFRGYVMQGLWLLVKQPVAIAIASALVFTLPHLANPEVAHSPLLVVPQYIVIGLLLAAVTLRDGRLEFAIGIHAANNLFIALIVNYDDSVITTDAIFTSGYDPLYSLMALIAASIAAYAIIFRRGTPPGPAMTAEDRSAKMRAGTTAILGTDTGMFSSAEIGQFNTDGYVIVRALAGETQRTAIRTVAEGNLANMVAPLEYEADTKYPGAPVSSDAPGGTTVRRLLQAYARDGSIAQWATAPAVAVRLKQLLGPAVRLSQAHHNCVMTKNPGYSSVTNWHQDIRYWSFERPELVSVWTALGREYPENGCLMVLPGTHTMNFEPEQFDGALFLRPDLTQNRKLIATQRMVELQPGDVLFFHCRLFHAAGSNRTSTTKFSLVFTYHVADNHSLPGTRSAALPEVELP